MKFSDEFVLGRTVTVWMQIMIDSRFEGVIEDYNEEYLKLACDASSGPWPSPACHVTLKIDGILAVAVSDEEKPEPRREHPQEQMVGGKRG